MNLTEEQIINLAPDEASKKSGKELANSAKWVTKGTNELAIWGECQGSGSKPYQAQIDKANIAFKCSCPSRKFPCKHGLRLLLLFQRDQQLFRNTDAPAWVTNWISKRNERQEKQTEKKDKPVDEAAQAKRQQARQTKVNDGIEEFTAWLKDIIRNGIISIPEKGTAFFENITRRLIDAQAPGLAGMVRNLGEINFYAEGWPNRFMDQLLRIFMIIEGYKNNTSLPEPLQQDIKTLIGFTQNQDELKEQPGITDTWLVLGKDVTEVDAITTEKFWLYGTQTGKTAMLLQFIVRGQGMQFNLTPGMYIEAELVFFPSTIPQRALIKRQLSTNAVAVSKTFQNWQQVAENETAFNSIMPFRSETVFIINQLKPVQYNNQWWLQDTDNNLVLMRDEHKYIWKLLAISGGQPMNMAVLDKEDQFEPIGVWQGTHYTSI